MTPSIPDEAVQADTHATAARLNRLLTVCHGLRWTDVGVLALENESTKKALGDLSEILFMDGIDDHMSDAIHALSSQPSKRERLLQLAETAGDTTLGALSSQPVADGWLPIETAPKDGAQILIEVHPGIFDVVCWSDDAWREGGNFMRLRKEPTHWRPLPSSPGASNTSQTGCSDEK